jgi:hypothetical protein
VKWLILILYAQFSFGQIKIDDVGDGWKGKVQQALDTIKKYDRPKYNLLTQYCKGVGYWLGNFSTSEGDKILLSIPDVKSNSINNIASALIHESMHIYMKQQVFNLIESQEEKLCYLYELNFLFHIPNVEPWLIENAKNKIKQL